MPSLLTVFGLKVFPPLIIAAFWVKIQRILLVMLTAYYPGPELQNLKSYLHRVKAELK